MVAGILAAITAVFTALPELLRLGKEVLVYFKSLLPDERKRFLGDMGEAFSKLNKPGTSADEKHDVAFDIARLIRRL